MDNMTWTTTDNRVVLVFTGGGVALRTTFLKTDNFFQPKVPAARSLAEIAGNGAKVADLRRGYRVRSLREAGKILNHGRVFYQLRKRNQRADSQTLRVGLDLIHAAYVFQIYQARRT